MAPGIALAFEIRDKLESLSRAYVQVYRTSITDGKRYWILALES